MGNRNLFNAIYRFSFICILALCFSSCNKNDEKDIFDNEDVPELLYGKWLGTDSRGQSLSLLIERDGACTYKRSIYVDADGIYTYDAKEKKITTTIEEIGSGPVVYVIELLTEDKLIVRREPSGTRISYTKDKDYIE